MNKSLALQYYNIVTFKEDLEYLCDSKATNRYEDYEGTIHWVFKDTSIMSLDKLGGVVIDGRHVN